MAQVTWSLFRMYPSWQEQEYDPIVLLHTWLQLDFNSTHSLISEKIKTNNYIQILQPFVTALLQIAEVYNLS